MLCSDSDTWHWIFANFLVEDVEHVHLIPYGYMSVACSHLTCRCISLHVGVKVKGLHLSLDLHWKLEA